MIQSYRTVIHFCYFSAGMVNHRQNLALIFRIGGARLSAFTKLDKTSLEYLIWFSFLSDWPGSVWAFPFQRLNDLSAGHPAAAFGCTFVPLPPPQLFGADLAFRETKPSRSGTNSPAYQKRSHLKSSILGLVLAANLRVKSLPAPRAGGLMGAVPPRCRLTAAQTKGDPRQVSASTWHFLSYRGSWQSAGVRFTGTAKAKKKHAKSERRWCQQQKVERGRLEGNHQSKVGWGEEKEWKRRKTTLTQWGLGLC